MLTARRSNARYVALAVLTLAQAGVAIVTAGLGSLSPFLVQTLHLSRAQIGIVGGVVGFMWMFTASTAGVIVDRFGERRVIVASGLIMAFTLWASALLQSFFWLVAWLALFGAVSTFSNPAGGRAVMLWFTRGRAAAMGVRQAGVPIGGFAAAVGLPPLAAHFGYQAALAVAGVAVLLASGSVAFLRESSHSKEKKKPHLRDLWKDMRVLSRDRRAILVALAQADHNVGQSCAYAFLPLSLIALAHESVSIAVLSLAILQVASIAGRFFWGAVSDRYLMRQRMIPIAFASLLGAVAEAILAIQTPHGSAFWTTVCFGASFLLGFTIAGCNGLFAVVQAEIAGPRLAGSALGIAAGRISIAMAFAPPLFGAVADAHGYSISWWLLTAVTLLAVVPVLQAHRALKSLEPDRDAFTAGLRASP